MSKALELEILDCMSQLDEEQQQSILQMIKSFLPGRAAKPARISIEQYNKEIDEAEARIDAGEFTTQEEVKRMAKNW